MRRKPARPQDLDRLLMHLDLSAAPLPSPCTGICRVDPETSLCEGCLRTIEEIMLWGGASEDSKASIWREIQTRHAARRKKSPGIFMLWR